MLTDLRKSVNYIIYERTTSPFWGSFIFSWLICNWKIILAVFVVSESKFSTNKIDYISQNFIGWLPNAIYPLISTLILIMLFPYLSNHAYWITLIYSKWRSDKKNEVEMQQLLTVEQSIAIRRANKEIQESYLQLDAAKEDEIKSLKLEIAELNKRLSEPAEVMVSNISKNSEKAKLDEWNRDYSDFTTSRLFGEFERLLIDVNSNYSMDSYGISKNSIIYFQSIEIIKINSHGAAYELTEKGLYFSKLYNKEKYERSN